MDSEEASTVTENLTIEKKNKIKINWEKVFCMSSFESVPKGSLLLPLSSSF